MGKKHKGGAGGGAAATAAQSAPAQEKAPDQSSPAAAPAAAPASASAPADAAASSSRHSKRTNDARPEPLQPTSRDVNGKDGAHSPAMSPATDFASQYSDKRSGRVAQAQAQPQAQQQSHTPARSTLKRKFSAKTQHAFLPDEEIAAHWVFRFLFWLSRVFFVPFNGFDMVGMDKFPKNKGVLYFGRHSTHNWDILAMIPRHWEVTGRVTRALFHRLLFKAFPILQYLGGVAGHRESAVALLESGFWCGVIPGGSDEALVGHGNCYKLHWPQKRKGFARVAMEANAMLVPWFTRNVEESRWNPVHELWHLIHGWVPYEWLIHARIPVVSAAVYKLGECVWFGSCLFSIPVPVICTTYFGEPVPYQPDEDVKAVVQRCHDALQALVQKHQPNAPQGRNYARALGERWVQWRGTWPNFTRTVEKFTPFAVKAFLARWAAGGKKRQ